MMEKIAGLLAHAESTDNAEEAAAYTEKAQTLATMYAIDLELARYKAAHKDDREELTTRRIEVGEKGRTHKNRFWVDLALAIGYANDIRCTIAGDRSAVWAYGYPSDIDVMEKLFVSLNVQMVGQCNEALRRGDHHDLGVHGRTFRPNFYEGFVETMEWRLLRARNEALEEQKRRDREVAELIAAAPKDDGDDIVAEPVMTGALVMVEKKKSVEDFYTRTNNAKGTYRSYGATSYNGSAQRMGAEAARNASLGGSPAALGGNRKEIG